MKVGIDARELDFWWTLFMVYLAIGSLTVLLFEWRRLRRVKTEEFMMHWRERRERGEPHQ